MTVAIDAHVDRSFRRQQRTDVDRQPPRRHTRADNELAVFALVCDRVENRTNEIGRYPCMRHVADEARLAIVGTHDFRPLVPSARSAVEHEAIDQLERAHAMAEANERADDAHLVRCVVVARFGDAREVLVIRSLERRARHE